MYEFQQKKKIIDLIFKICIAATLAFMLIAPLFGAWFKANTRLYTDISTVMILVTVATTFLFSRFKKAGLFVDRIAAEIKDCGYYITALKAQSTKDYETEVYNKLNAGFFSVYSDVQLSGRDFSFKAVKKHNTLFFARCKKLGKADFFAYNDAVNLDVSASNIRQKQNVVMVIVAEKIDDDVLAYSKMTTALGKAMVYPLLIDISNLHAYFFQDNTGKINFALENVLDYPRGVIPESAKIKEQLPFQKDLEKKMLLFSIKEYREGRFNPRT